MSELSVRQYLHNDGSGLTWGYDKREVDKVIAELKGKAEHDCAHWKMQFENSKTSLRETEEACLQYNLERNHSNYKRCLAMAKLCQWKMGVFIYKKEKNEFYYRWYNRWLVIAEQFKKAK